MLFDGGMGSEIEKAGLNCAFAEDLNITASDEIRNIHLSYAASDFITTNTFGLNRIKYKGQYQIKDIALKAIENARASNKKVFFDIGPTGAMLKPLGTLEFDQAYEAYKEIVDITKDLVDGYILETFSDLYEIKSAILAVKENSSKPLFATMTFTENGRTLTGSTPEIVVNTLQGLGVDALGVNCSLGPKELLPIVKEFIKYSHLPVIVQANRGLPQINNGKTVYSLSVEEFSYYAEKFVSLGVSLIGGCCGTTPEFINSLKFLQGREVTATQALYETKINSALSIANIENISICGERLNPTGKKRLKEALKNKEYDYLISEAIAQEEKGAQILDINVGVPGENEAELMYNACTRIQEYISLPLQIDSTDVKAIEIGARYYNGIPLINSVNGDDKVMESIFPIVKKYGACVIGLTLDENGIPKTASERFEIAKKIVNKAKEYGIDRSRIIIDTLVLTASAEQSLVTETLKALTLVKTLGVKTALGVSNVSFGLPFRPLLNKTFLTMAMQSGLNMPILNPLDDEMMNAVRAYKVLAGIDKNSEKYIEFFNEVQSVNAPSSEKEISFEEAIKKGLKNSVIPLLDEKLKENEPMQIINQSIIPALEEIGVRYDKGQIYLPQLISAAEAAKSAFEYLSKLFPKDSVSKCTVIMATVKGDVHDIGKNIVKVVLESYGYMVIDLGKDTPTETVLDACGRFHPKAVGLSALMTTTVKSMEDTVRAIKEKYADITVFIGGAVITQDIANKIGADYYAPNALEFVKILDTLI